VGEAVEDEEIALRARARLGAWLKDKYRLDRILGVGGMAVVYAATHRNQAEFAVKVLHPELSLRRDLRTRFLREGYVANSVKHSGVVRVVDDDVAEDGAAFLVMDLLQGEPVESIWEKHGKALEPKAAIAIGWQLLDVLAVAHAKSIVHRDIKPANVFVTHEGIVKVLDFGIARHALHSDSATQAGVMMGTPAFMAPEQAMAKTEEIDAQTDIWAVGATLFTLLSGCLVHDGDNSTQLLIKAATAPAPPLASVAPHVPQRLAAVVDRALCFEKAMRWPDATAMRDALREASLAMFGEGPSRRLLLGLLGLEDVVPRSTERPPAEVTTQQPVASERLTPVPTRRPAAAVLLGIALAAVALVAVVALAATRSGRTKATAAGSAATSVAAPGPVPPVATLAPVEPPSESPSEAPAPPATPTPAMAVPAHAAPVHPAATAKPAHPRKGDCAVPYTLDANGNKKWKVECLGGR
jgi:serine/threonine-protein kinase